MTNDIQQKTVKGRIVTHAFRRAVLRGLAVLSPPLLTILLIVWAINTTRSYFLEPVMGWAREGIVWGVRDIQHDLPLSSASEKTAISDGLVYRRIENGAFIPEDVYEIVQRSPGPTPPVTGEDYYRRYVDLTYLKPYIAIPFFLTVFVLTLYFLGKFIAAGIGGFFISVFDRTMSRVPGVRSVYSSIKQVSDFVFSEREMKFTRIIAVEFPSPGLWSIGFVTGEGFATVRDAVGEPTLVVLIPYSPIPHTGCTVIVRKSKCVDLNITFDQACQFIVSCGVVVPPHELCNMMAETDEDKPSPT